MTSGRAGVWMWMSPDGPILFSSRLKAFLYIQKCYPGGQWKREQRDVWSYTTDGIELHVHREEVQ